MGYQNLWQNIPKLSTFYTFWSQLDGQMKCVLDVTQRLLRTFYLSKALQMLLRISGLVLANVPRVQQGGLSFQDMKNSLWRHR